MEIVEYKQLNKGALQGKFNLKIPKWGNLIIRDMSYFKGDKGRWISFPSRQFEADGKTKYFSYLIFEDPKMKEDFEKKVLQTLDKYFELNNPAILATNDLGAPPF